MERFLFTRKTRILMWWHNCAFQEPVKTYFRHIIITSRQVKLKLISIVSVQKSSSETQFWWNSPIVKKHYKISNWSWDDLNLLCEFHISLSHDFCDTFFVFFVICQWRCQKWAIFTMWFYWETLFFCRIQLKFRFWVHKKTLTLSYIMLVSFRNKNE